MSVRPTSTDTAEQAVLLFDALRAQRQHNEPYLKMVSPMVRYSKLPFRMLCRRWGADLCYTPMIIASAFNRSQTARDSEFTSNELDRPLVAQFGTCDPVEMVAAAQKCAPYVDGVDINCGCPQKWAMGDGIGAALSSKPDLVADMVKETRQRVPHLPLSIKIRIRDDLRKTLDLVQQAEQAGCAWVTVHGRTARQRGGDPVDLAAIKIIKEVAKVPVVANGDIFTCVALQILAQRVASL